MLRSVLAILFVLILANVPLAQQSAKPEAQPARANRCDNATTQADMRINAPPKNIARRMLI